MAGIIIGALGVLDDVTVSQAAVAEQLYKINSKIKRKELFSRTMNIGQDHIASVANTLILVYTGASLSLLLLFIDNPFTLFSSDKLRNYCRRNSKDFSRKYWTNFSSANYYLFGGLSLEK